MSLQGHKKRLLVAAIAIPLIVFFILKLPPYFFLGLLTVVNSLAVWEFLKIYRASNFWSSFGVPLSTALFLLNCFYYTYALYYYSITFVMITLIRLLSKRDPSQALYEISPLITALLYIPTLLTFIWFLRDFGALWIIYLFGVVWVSDSFAYYIGKGFGKRKLYPEVSPKKTWAGAWGSLFGGVIASVALGSLFNLKGLDFLIFVGIAIGVISIFGDLVESMFKRDGGVKDSSFLFPEHGGVLDKIDSMLFAGILLFFAVKFL